MAINILFVGGSYGGIAALLNLLDLCHGNAPRSDVNYAMRKDAPRSIPVKITLVDERDGFYHLIGSPLAYADEKFAEKAWIKFDHLSALQSSCIERIHGSVTHLNAGNKRATIKLYGTTEEIQQSYDYVVVASGIKRNAPAAPFSLSRKAYLLETSEHVFSVRNSSLGVVVIGGGAVGVEFAAELKHMHPSVKVTLIHSRDTLLSSEPLPAEFKLQAKDALEQQGVRLVLGKRVASQIQETHGGHILQRLILSDETEITAGHVINAVSKMVPASSFLTVEWLDDSGYVPVDDCFHPSRSLQNQQNQFVLGDVIASETIKRCGGAMYQGFHVAVNIWQQMLQDHFGLAPDFMRWKSHSPIMCLALGKTAVSYYQGKVSFGEELLKESFQDDMSLKSITDYLQFDIVKYVDEI